MTKILIILEEKPGMGMLIRFRGKGVKMTPQEKRVRDLYVAAHDHIQEFLTRGAAVTTKIRSTSGPLSASAVSANDIIHNAKIEELRKKGRK